MTSCAQISPNYKDREISWLFRTKGDISGLKAGDPRSDAGYNTRERSRVPFLMKAVAATVPGFVHREPGKCLDGKM